MKRFHGCLLAEQRELRDFMMTLSIDVKKTYAVDGATSVAREVAASFRNNNGSVDHDVSFCPLPRS